MAEDEYDGGTILNVCPHCGQFCKRPKTYRPRFRDGEFVGAFARGYCTRCRKRVDLGVVYI